MDDLEEDPTRPSSEEEWSELTLLMDERGSMARGRQAPDDFIDARGLGVYEIWLLENYCPSWRPVYLGVTCGRTQGLRVRLDNHGKLATNLRGPIRSAFAEGSEVWARYIQIPRCCRAAELERELYDAFADRYPWNVNRPSGECTSPSCQGRSSSN
jgi:hypothetical protein